VPRIITIAVPLDVGLHFLRDRNNISGIEIFF
jgi:hypothetical protein